jgi:hypothetical protein
MDDENLPPPAPPGLSPFLRNILDSARPSTTNSVGKAAGKQTLTGGTSSKHKAPKHAGASLASSEVTSLQKWFHLQCDDLSSRRFTTNHSDSNLTNNWGSTVSVKCAFDGNCFSTMPPDAPSNSAIGNGSLGIIFEFYAKLQKPGTVSLLSQSMSIPPSLTQH